MSIVSDHFTGAAYWDRVVRQRPLKAAARLVHLEAKDEAGRKEWKPTIEGLRAALDRAVRCRVCGRRLTDQESVARHIGPDCFAKMKGAAA